MISEWFIILFFVLFVRSLFFFLYFFTEEGIIKLSFFVSDFKVLFLELVFGIDEVREVFLVLRVFCIGWN